MPCRYEPGDIGGRTQTFEHEGCVYEMGASIIHGQNRYFRCILITHAATGLACGDTPCICPGLEKALTRSDAGLCVHM